MHFGRKKVQPPRDVLRQFSNSAKGGLDFEPLWFDDAKAIWAAFAEETRAGLRLFANIPATHPVWSERPYKVFLYTPDDVRRVIAYIEANPAKEGLAPQHWPFVTPYDGWPLTPKSR